MKRYSSRFTVWMLLGWGSMQALLYSQEPTETPPADFPAFQEEARTFPSIDLPTSDEPLELELVIHRWGETDAASQVFTLSLSEIPDFLSRATLSESEIEFEADTSEISLTLTLVNEDAEEASQGQLVIEVVSEDESVSPPRRKLILPLNNRVPIEEEEIASNYAFVLRTLEQDYDRPRGDRLPDWVQHLHDEDLPLFTVDPIYICFTGSKEEVNFGYYRIYGPDGSLFQEGTNSEDYDRIFRKDVDEEAPYNVILPLYISHYPEGATEDEDRRMRPPGEYKLEVAEAILSATTGTSIFGLPTESKPGEWIPVGSFEINEPTFQYQGTASLVFPNESPERQPYLEVSPVAGGGSNGSVTITAEWDDEHYNEETRKWEPVFMSKTTDLNYEFPGTILYSALEDLPDSRTTLSFEVSDYWSAGISSTSGLWVVKPDDPLIEKEEDSIFFDYPDSIGLTSVERDIQPGRHTVIQDFIFSRHTDVFYGYPLDKIGMNLGWALRTPGMKYAMSHTVNVSEVVGNIGTIKVYGVYQHEPGTLTIPELEELSLTMERPDRDQDEGDSEGERDGSQDGNRADPQGTLAGGGLGTNQGGGGSGSGRGGSGSGAGDSSGSGGLGGGQGGPIDPNALDPNAPDIAGLIAAWIGMAEPPMNATHGANLRYNEWGVVHGTTRQGTITETPGKPDEVGLRSSPEYLWQEKRDLDSVNHCTLGEFVISSLAGASMAHCVGRYQPLPRFNVPQVVGMTMDQAEAKVTGESLTPEWVAGPPAPNDRLTGTVASQFPVQGSEAVEGDPVTLEIYIEPIRLITLPDVLGKPIDAAEQELQNLGLEVVLELGDPAQSAAQQYTVQLQTPPSGEQVDEASSVTLAIFSDFFPEIVMPDLVGQSMEQAEQTLANLELEVALAVGDPASSTASNNRVQAQNPLAGTILHPGDSATLTVFSDYVPPPTQVAGSDPTPPTPSGGFPPPPTDDTGNSTGGRPSAPATNLAFLPPVEQIVVPGSIQGISLNTGKATTTRADYKNWLLGDNATHRTYMVAYGRGDPFGNFFEDDTDDTTYFFTIATWLEEGDSWGENQQFAPSNRTEVETKTGDEVFLNEDNDAVSYHYSRKGVPAKVILTVAKERLNSFSASFRQNYADDIFEQLLGGVKVTASSSAIPSTVLQIRTEATIGRIAKIPLHQNYSQAIGKPSNEWMHPEDPVRYARFTYEKENSRQYIDGKVDVELYWLESDDPLQSRNQIYFEQLTEWKQPRFVPGAFNTSLQPGPLYLHGTEHHIAIKLTSNNEFNYFEYSELESFSERLFSQLRGQSLKKKEAYTRIQNFRLPSKFQELIPSDSTRDLKPRSQKGEFLGSNAIALPDGKHAVAFFRQISFAYYTGNKNQGGSNSGSGVFGLPTGEFETVENDRVSCYLYWIEKGDPYSPDLARAFIGRDTVETDNRFANIGTTVFTFHSSRVAARITAHVDNNQGPQRKAAIQALANDLFRQLEGKALHPGKIPNSPRSK